jgi:hypothetical protein
MKSPSLYNVDHGAIMDRNYFNPPSLLSVPEVSIPLLGDIYIAAAELYRLTPWQLLKDETPIEVRYPYEATARLVVITGAGGDVPGFSAYDSTEDLMRMYAAENPIVVGRELNWLSLTYDTDVYIANDDLKAIERYGWPVVNEDAYPGIVRMGSPDADMYPPTSEDICWLDGAMSALIAFFQNPSSFNLEQELQHGAFDLEINTRAGLKKVYLRHPASGITFASGG